LREVGEINGRDSATRRGASVSHRPAARLAEEHSRGVHSVRAAAQGGFVGLRGDGARGRGRAGGGGDAAGGIGGGVGVARDAAAFHRRAVPGALGEGREREGGRNGAVAGELDAGAAHQYAVARGADGEVGGGFDDTWRKEDR